MRITCLIATLDAGGAERVLVTLANAWAGDGHVVEVLTLQGPGAPVAFQIDERVELRQLGDAARQCGRWSRAVDLVRRLARLRGVLRRTQPDVLLCFIASTNVLGLLATRGLRLPVVISERIHPAYHPLRWPIPSARRLFYPWASALVVQTEGIAQWFRDRLGLDAHVIPNPIDMSRFPPRVTPNGRNLLVSVGRLSKQKGYDTLIAAFAHLRHAAPDWDLVIYGEGPERGGLEDLIARNGLKGRVALPGVVQDVPERLAAASLYVQPSRYEGFPNTVLEALAAGCPVVATDAPGATAEILDGGRFGVLVPVDDVTALAATLSKLMNDPNARDKFASNARDGAARYDVGPVSRRWITLFESLR